MCCRFKDTADLAGQAVAPPQYAARRASPEGARCRVCHYCGTEHAESAFEEHLVAVHAQLLFHCEECDTYVDRKDFILHMSVHAVQYASGPAAPASEVNKKKDGHETTERREGAGSPPPPPDADDKNEFSDHSDTEFGFGPLPESVFEAIEDSQDSRPAGGGDAPARSPPGGGDPERPAPEAQKTKAHKKARTCPLCSKEFTASSSYFYHMKHFHRRSREHECDVCGKKFATRANLVQHGPIHTGECRFECQQCGKRFKSKASRYIHAQTHSDLRKYPCPQCHKTFRWRTHLLRHAKRHAAEKSHVCSECGRGFSVKCDLLRHARTHAAGEFACDTCGLKFAQLRYLAVHAHRKHAAPPRSPPAGGRHPRSPRVEHVV